MCSHAYYLYILATSKNAMLYIGVTNDMARRLSEHQSGETNGYTKKFHVHKLVYFESFEDVRNAIDREKQLKRWSRAKKNALVERMNPEWKDLGNLFLQE